MAIDKAVDSVALDAGLTSIANAIRAKSGTSAQLNFPDGMASAVERIPTGGNSLFDQYSTNYAQLFYGADFPIGFDFDMELASKKAQINISEMFRYSRSIRSVNLKANQNAKSVFMMASFAACENLQTVDLSKFPIKPINIPDLCNGCGKLTAIVGEFDLSQINAVQYTRNAFLGCKLLVTVRFLQNTIKVSISFADSPLLSNESIKSIIDGLTDLTGSAAQVLTLHPDVRSKLTPEQIASITSKNWTLA